MIFSKLPSIYLEIGTKKIPLIIAFTPDVIERVKPKDYSSIWKLFFNMRDIVDSLIELAIDDINLHKSNPPADRNMIFKSSNWDYFYYFPSLYYFLSSILDGNNNVSIHYNKEP